MADLLTVPGQMTGPGQLVVRPARPDDCAAILAMMRELARFEGYESEFRVTAKALHDGLFRQRQFHVLTASREGALVGLLTYYFLPFTYDLSPWIYIKELYVDKNHRSQGVGRALMKQVAAICRENGGSKIRWDVLSDNDTAKIFYLSLGAACEQRWALFSLDKNRLTNL